MISATTGTTYTTDCGNGIYLITYAATNIVSCIQEIVGYFRLPDLKFHNYKWIQPKKIPFRNAPKLLLRTVRLVPCRKTASRSKRRFYINKLHEA